MCVYKFIFLFKKTVSFRKVWFSIPVFIGKVYFLFGYFVGKVYICSRNPWNGVYNSNTYSHHNMANNIKQAYRHIK